MHKWQETFRSLILRYPIPFSVIVCHLLAIAALTFSPNTRRPLPPKPIQIATQNLPSAPLKKVLKSATPSPPSTSSRSPSKAKKSAPLTPLKTSSQEPSLSPQTLQTLLRDLETLTPTETKPKDALTIPSCVTKVELERREEKDKETLQYPLAVLQVFADQLALPEEGDVKVKLHISQEGKILSCDILSFQSEKNGLFLKKRLPELALPCFNDFGICNEAIDFTLTFHSRSAH